MNSQGTVEIILGGNPNQQKMKWCVLGCNTHGEMLNWMLLKVYSLCWIPK